MTPEQQQQMMMLVKILGENRNGVIRPQYTDPGINRPMPPGYGNFGDPGPMAGGDSSLHPEMIPDEIPNGNSLPPPTTDNYPMGPPPDMQQQQKMQMLIDAMKAGKARAM